MKKIIAIFLAFSLMFVFVSCVKKPDVSQTATESSVTEETAETKTTAEQKTQTEAVRETTEIRTSPTAAQSATSAEAVTTVEQTTETGNICTVSIDCSQIMNNPDKLKTEKEPFLPSGGYIVESLEIEFVHGESAFDVFRRVCNENVCADNCTYCQSGGIQYEASYSAGYDNYYIEGIHQIYEKDCGPKSGWMYRVNGTFLNYGCSSYTVRNGDVIEFLYTCNLGEDIGNI